MMSRIATQFLYRLWLLLGMIMRISCRLTFGLELVVGATFDILQILGKEDFQVQPQCYNRVEWPVERFFMNC